MSAGRRLTVCVGAGGVGKTTVAAALALARARRGERVAVVTIDPAPALARALGLATLGGEPQRVEGAGELWALRLDAKRTLDELISSLAADEGARDRALSNRIYRELSAAVAGSQEFSAVAKLYELDRSGRYDAIVLDTPPSRNALDFLDAPARLMRFFDGRAVRVLMAQGGSASRAAARAGAPLLGMLGRLTGAGALREIVAFFGAIGGMVDGLGARAAAVEALLHDPATSFVLISSPRREAVEEAIAFAAALEAARLPIGALAVNRVHVAAGGADGELDLDALLGARLAQLVRESVRELGERAAADGESVARLRAALPGLPTFLVPELGAELSNLAELDRLGGYLNSVGSPSVAQ
jgi:anion-transporting  ArsA/GET3 family ATPase